MVFWFKWPRGLTEKLKAKGLTDASIVVLAEMLTWWNRASDGRISPSKKTLMKNTGCSSRTIQRAFRSFEKARLLEIDSGGAGRDSYHWIVTKTLISLLSEDDNG